MSTHPCTCKEPYPVTLDSGARACFTCGGLLPQKEGEAEKNCSTMDAALIARRFQEFRRAYRALESCLREQGIEVK